VSCPPRTEAAQPHDLRPSLFTTPTRAWNQTAALLWEAAFQPQAARDHGEDKPVIRKDE
jgi:hypothetical protein